MRLRLARFVQDESGQSLVEFAITFSILMGFVFMFIEVCLMFYTYGMISECAREGSRYAATHGATCVTAGSASCTADAPATNTYVTGLGYPNLAGGTMVANTTFPDGTQAVGNHAKVSITYTFPITLALVPRSAWTLTTASTLTILR